MDYGGISPVWRLEAPITSLGPQSGHQHSAVGSIGNHYKLFKKPSSKIKGFKLFKNVTENTGISEFDGFLVVCFKVLICPV